MTDDREREIRQACGACHDDGHRGWDDFWHVDHGGGCGFPDRCRCAEIRDLRDRAEVRAFGDRKELVERLTRERDEALDRGDRFALAVDNKDRDIQILRTALAAKDEALTLYSAAADKFIEKVDSGAARSRITYAELKAARAAAALAETGEGKG